MSTLQNELLNKLPDSLCHGVTYGVTVCREAVRVEPRGGQGLGASGAGIGLGLDLLGVVAPLSRAEARRRGRWSAAAAPYFGRVIPPATSLRARSSKNPGQQIVREHGTCAATPTLLDEVFQRRSPAGEEADPNGTIEFCRQQPAHLTAGLVRPFVARACGREDDVVVVAQSRKAIGKDLRKPRIRPKRRRPPNVTAGLDGSVDRLSEVDMDVIPRGEQAARGSPGGRQAGG